MPPPSRPQSKDRRDFGQLDILVNNAGTAIPKPFEEATLEELDHMIDINIRGVLRRHAGRAEAHENGGRIITIGSCVGERMMTPGLVAYSATKGAVKMFTQGLSPGRWGPGASPSTMSSQVRSTPT